MSKLHPIIAVTGSSGAGTSDVKTAFEEIFRREGIEAAVIEGDCFHRYNRRKMDEEVELAKRRGKNITHFGPEGNLFEELEAVFHEYSTYGTGRRRYYIHNEDEAALHGHPPGALTHVTEVFQIGTDVIRAHRCPQEPPRIGDHREN